MPAPVPRPVPPEGALSAPWPHCGCPSPAPGGLFGAAESDVSGAMPDERDLPTPEQLVANATASLLGVVALLVLIGTGVAMFIVIKKKNEQIAAAETVTDETNETEE